MKRNIQAAALIMLLLPWLVAAQSKESVIICRVDISGCFLDASGAPIRNRPVVLRIIGSTSSSVVTRTDQDGTFSFVVNAGSSGEVFFESPGFMRVVVPIRRAVGAINLGKIVVQVARTDFDDPQIGPPIQTHPSSVSRFHFSPILDSRQVPACLDTRCTGKRIKDNLGVLRFCIPRGVDVRTEVGDHGDVHYSIKVRLHGRSYELLVASGPYFPGRLPEWTNGCNVRHWHNPESRGEDCRLETAATASRYITLNAPMGYAVYRDVPAEVAARFDLVLDSLCWSDWHSAVGVR